MLFRTSIITIALSLSACSSWVYRIDIPQGNYLEQKSIDKIQVGMTKEQVKFVLGSPVLVDSFDKDTWNYVYRFKSGRSEKLDTQKNFTMKFEDNKLVSADGDFELSENFHIPFNAPIIQNDEQINTDKQGS
ncbi:outer membrane protein assembly factor BamE [Colwellia sp. 4_MG-2023]|jgi:outer membrane protein assembly factor BamE|uniref:outer membrane protein assembly factor BamE n=1 Tax=unclassified Colwellia TaxID=196834 RepID=UPI001C09C134|nr:MULTISPECIES: outer membrane protein assembly factor BamE [unclassified Colwellia]MBU2925614.1 outer membrane protein assembly factor BamE [Colwellia sp. C2M11]MDO6507538.1 outer membrane protein assembly factor BamE [Colwellia sp. 5_MG-2023]MDO6556204.1 outer membrane protein assembly factor BamE [Colwellia sp. 4_MG-2023]MDO6651160.1 outer membrane protein assembly factor BamE [Colwellia sp. 3_MG-2023]MDO6666454.1 outer membrane protein assembly factor BamE [Colwellia sp. 2_MG-2023]